jgi:hypothetical protein
MEGSTLSAFGLELQADFPLPGLHRTAERLKDPISLQVVNRSETARRWEPAGSKGLWSTVIDGCGVLLETGRAGDHRIVYGDRAEFWLSKDLDELLCAPTDRQSPEWQRFLLDTVLGVTSLLRGFEALHASAVVRRGALVAIIANTGGGKTSVAAELLRRGATLFCDDILALRRQLGSVAAYPGPALMNLPASGWMPEGAQTLARLGDEEWIQLNDAPPDRAVPRAIFLLERAPGAPNQVTALPPSPLPLLPHVLATATLRQRARTRFELVADLAAGARLLRVEADIAATPAALADMVEEALEAAPPAVARAGA